MGDNRPEVNFEMVGKIITKARNIFGASPIYSDIVKKGGTFVNLVESEGKFYLSNVYFKNGDSKIVVTDNAVFVYVTKMPEKMIFAFNSFDEFIHM